MERIISKKQAWLNKVHLTEDDDLYIGIEAHKESFHVALWLNDAPAIDFVMPPDSTKLIDILNKLRPALRLVVYEAGPTGYSLARALQDAALPVSVVAPSETPRQSAPDSKTDRLDTRKLARQQCCHYLSVSDSSIGSNPSGRLRGGLVLRARIAD